MEKNRFVIPKVNPRAARVDRRDLAFRHNRDNFFGPFSKMMKTGHRNTTTRKHPESSPHGFNPLQNGFNP
jgi:hypothetical protein